MKRGPIRTFTNEELETILMRARDKSRLVIENQAELIWAIYREAFGLSACVVDGKKCYIKQEIERALTLLK